MWMDCLMNFLHPSEFMWFYVIFLHLFSILLMFCGCSDLFGFFLILCDLFEFLVIRLDLSWFIWIFLIFCDLFQFFVICCALFGSFVICFNFSWFGWTHYHREGHILLSHIPPLKCSQKWWEMMFIWCGTHDVTCLSLFVLLLLHKCDHMIFHIFEHFYQILYK